MNRKTRLTLKMRAKELPFEVIVKSIAKGHTLLFLDPTSPRCMNRKREIVLLTHELKDRGFGIILHPMPLGMVLEMVPTQPIHLASVLGPENKHCISECSMTIPSVDDILNAPLPLDLPAHGYLHA